MDISRSQSFGHVGTPVLADCGEGRTDLVIAVPNKIWGLDPQTGKRRWHCEGLNSDSICTSAFVNDGIVYVFETGPRGGGTMAVKAGGEGDVTNTAILWRGTARSRIETPVIDGNRIYWAGNKTADCVDAATGKSIYHDSITGGPAPADRPAAVVPVGRVGQAGPDGDGPAALADPADPAGRAGRAGLVAAPVAVVADAAAAWADKTTPRPVLADGKIYYVSRSGTAYVYAAGPEYKLVSQNKLTGGGDFSATPAISDGQIFIRSSKYLYCIADARK